MQNTAAKSACSWAMGYFFCKLLLPQPLSALRAYHPDWPLALQAQPQLLRPPIPCQKAEPLQLLFTLKLLIKWGEKTTPTNAAWGAIEHVKTLRLEFLGVWRSEIDWEQTGRDISLKIWSKAAMGASQPTRTRKKHFTRQTNSLSQQQKQKKLNDCLLEVSH